MSLMGLSSVPGGRCPVTTVPRQRVKDSDGPQMLNASLIRRDGPALAEHNTPMTMINPVVPFQVAIPGTISRARKITIVGNVPFHANSFHVNLKNSMTGNIALHINPRLRERALVRNTQTHGTWGSEERQLSTLPFAPGQAFQMEIVNTRNCYQVSVNGLRVFDYVHRIPANQVDQLQIAGDVTLSCVQY